MISKQEFAKKYQKEIVGIVFKMYKECNQLGYDFFEIGDLVFDDELNFDKLIDDYEGS